MASSDWDYSLAESSGQEKHAEVAFILSPMIPLPNYAGNSIATLTAALANRLPYRSLVFSMPTAKAHAEERKFDIAYYQAELKESAWDTNFILKRFRYYFSSITPTSWQKYAKSAAEECIRLGVKVVVIEDVADFGWAMRELRRHGIKIILHQHAFTQRNFRSPLWHRIEWQLDQIVFVSEKTKALTEAKHGELSMPSQVIYNGVDLEHYDPGIWLEKAETTATKLGLSKKQPVVGYIGRFARNKGLLELLQAYKMLGRKDLALLVIVGRDQVEEPLFVEQFEALKKEILFEEYPFFFYEDLPQIEIPKWYALCKLLVVPSVGSEGLPKNISEALAMGVPVIASERGGIWELLEEGRNGWKIEEPVSAETIREALEKALSLSEEEGEEMRKQILETDRPKMDVKLMVNQMKSLIVKLIGEGK